MDIDELLLERYNFHHDINPDIYYDPIKIVTIKLRQKLNSYISLNKICNFYELPEKLNDIYSQLENKAGIYQLNKTTPKNNIMKIVSSCISYDPCDYCTNIDKSHSKYSYMGVIQLNEENYAVKIIKFEVHLSCFPYFMYVTQIAPFVPNYLLLLCSQYTDHVLPIDVIKYIGFIILQQYLYLIDI